MKMPLRVAIYSDLHCEFGEFIPPQLDADIVILAGDIHIKLAGIEWAAKHFNGLQVIYVPGNHEYYGSAYPKHLQKMKEKSQDYENIHVLDQDTAKFGGVTFVACTLWTDFELYGNARIAGYHAQQIMTDYKRIRISPTYSKLRSIDVAVIHRQQRQWLEATLERLKGSPTVVITHHGPSARSLTSENSDDLISAAYVSNMDSLIKQYQPRLWVHGHLHNSSDYNIEGTKVICNPKGYLGEENINFKSTLIYEIE